MAIGRKARKEGRKGRKIRAKREDEMEDWERQRDEIRQELGLRAEENRWKGPRHEGKGKGGGLDEQRWWDAWWAMKEWSGEDLEIGDSGKRLRQEEWNEIRSRKLRNGGMRMAER